MNRGRLTFCAPMLFASFLSVSCVAADNEVQPFDPQRIPFSVLIDGELYNLRVFGLYVMPADTIDITIPVDSNDGSFRTLCTGGNLDQLSIGHWNWIAPLESSLTQLMVFHGTDTILLNVFTMIPATAVRDGLLNGYRIGAYPEIPFRGLAVYDPPTGFVEVTLDNMKTLLSPHFRLEQFLCKQDGDFPKYVVLREELMRKLELILGVVNRQGYHCQSFKVLSGFRTPYYNHAIGNVKYSRHQWGGAADIFIDEDPVDGMMDDLNRDGKVNWQDAALLYDIIDSLYDEPHYRPFIGGLGRYRKTSNHGPFVHVDVRGYRARWGD